ncbi:MAG: radical SAM protein [Candidatus Paceibacterales bacterium]
MKCEVCQEEKVLAKILSSCRDCLREHPEKTKSLILKAHRVSREEFGLPYPPPKAKGGVICQFCQNKCQLGEGAISFCGLRKNENGKLKVLADREEGILQWYYDPLPTNCVASFFCQGSEEFEKKNLAVFYGSCTFNCLFCQNWHYKYLAKSLSPKVSAKTLIGAIDKDTFCICFFGGDPTPQISYALKTCESIFKKENSPRHSTGRGEFISPRICWETNGAMSENLLRKIAEFSLKSGGIIKFDLKAFNENLHYALCGVSNRQTFKNFEFLAKEYLPKARGGFLAALTLLVPGYIDRREIEKIAKFIANLNPNIPYSLLGFYPHFFMRNLPLFSQKEAQECLTIAKEVGLENVRLGNLNLFS